MIDTDAVVAIVQAGGRGSRMDVLTRERAKPGLPFGGVHRLIDFPLSSLRHSEIRHVWVSIQYQASTLDEYLAGGRPWDLDATRGGFRLLIPETGAGSPDEDGFAHGNADLLLRLRAELEQCSATTVVVTSADHVFAMDLRPVIARHLEAGAAATLVTTQTTKTEAAHHVVVESVDGRARSISVKPSKPSSTTVLAEIFIYDKVQLLQAVDRLRSRLAAERVPGEDEALLGDFGEHLLPELIDTTTVLTWPIEGYHRDLGRPDVYMRAHRELLAGDVDDVWGSAPLLSHRQDRPATRLRSTAVVQNSLVAAGCDIAGEVRDSVLGHGVVVEEGAVVEGCLLFDDVRVERGARLATSIVDDAAVIERGAVVGVARGRRLPADADLVLIGRDSVVGAKAELAPGARLEPGTRA